MGAPKGNKNAEVWTEEAVLDVIAKVHNCFVSGTEYTLSGALDSIGIYADWWGDMTTKFKENTVVSRAIKKAEKKLESKIVNDTMTGDAKSATFSIFLLKNKFGYVDKQESENTHQISGINLKDLVKFND